MTTERGGMNNSVTIADNDLTPEQKRELCDYFIDEYKRDYNSLNACLRMGIDPSIAFRQARMFMENTYVLDNLSADKVLKNPNKLENVEDARQFVTSTLFSIAQKGSYKDRIEACKQIAQIYGLNKVDSPTVGSGFTNVIEVPMKVDEAEWESMATTRMKDNLEMPDK